MYDDYGYELDFDTDDSRAIIHELLIEALTEEDVNHKQWYLEQIAEHLGHDLESMRIDAQWIPGVRP